VFSTLGFATIFTSTRNAGIHTEATLFALLVHESAITPGVQICSLQQGEQDKEKRTQRRKREKKAVKMSNIKRDSNRTSCIES